MQVSQAFPEAGNVQSTALWLGRAPGANGRVARFKKRSLPGGPNLQLPCADIGARGERDSTRRRKIIEYRVERRARSSVSSIFCCSARRLIGVIASPNAFE